MRNLLAVTLALGNFSAYADCTYFKDDSSGSISQSRVAKNEMRKKGYIEAPKENAEYTLKFSSNFYTQGGNGRTIAETILINNQSNQIVAQGYGNWNTRDHYNQSVEGRKRLHLLHIALRSLPDCSELND